MSTPIAQGAPQPPSGPPSGPLPGVAPQQASPTASTTATTIVRPTTPIMGGLFLSSKDEYAAWTGGKPKPDWTGLDSSAPASMCSPNQIRPMYATSQVKGYNLRIEGLETKLTLKDSDFLDFITLVFDRLENTRMDSVSYLPDPLEPTNMVSVVKNFARFTLEYVQTETATLMTMWDDYDRQNDQTAVRFLLNSLHDNLCKLIQTRKESDDSFTVVWLRLVDIIMTSSVERYDAIKDRLKNHKPSDYAGEDIVLLSQDFQTDAQQLEIGGKYDHDLTLKVLQIFLMAGGDGREAEDYRHTLRNIQDDLSTALIKVSTMERDVATKYLSQNNLTVKFICKAAEKKYLELKSSGRWPPAKHASDSRAVPSAFNLSKIELMTLIQQSMTSGKCHNCGEEGHWANNCPKKKSPSGPTPTRSKPQGQKPSGKTDCHWRSMPPKEGESQTKVVEGIMFKWCAKCKRWSTTHATATHTRTKRNANKGNRGYRPSAVPSRPSPTTSGSAHANLFLVPDPLAWLVSLESPTLLEFFCTMVGLFLPVITFIAGSVITYLWSDTMWDVVQVILTPVDQWFREHPLSLIPVLFWLLLLVAVLVLPLLSWFRVDEHPIKRRELRAYTRAYRRATKHRRYVRLTRPQPPSVTDQAILTLARTVDEMARKHTWLARQHRLGHRVPPARGHPSSGPRPVPVSAPHPKPLTPPPNLPLPASLATPDIPFCLPCFGAYVRDGLPRSSPLAKGCTCCMTSTRLARHAQCASSHRAKVNDTNKTESTCTSCWLPKGQCHCKYPSISTRCRRFVQRASNSVRDDSGPDPPVTTETLKMAPIHDDALGSLRNDPALCEQAVPTFALHSAAEDKETWLRMALQAPLRFFSSLAHNPEPMTIIWDSGASASITLNKQTFVKGVKHVPTSVKLIGLAKNLRIEGVGKVAWNVLDHHGNLRLLCIPAYYVPGSLTRLLSTSSLLQTYPNETILIEPHQLKLSGVPGLLSRAPVTVRIDPTNNLPTCMMIRPEDSVQAITALSLTISVVSSSNVNLLEPQKELLRWHYHLGHLGFRKLQFIMRSGVLAHSKHTRHLHTTVCKLKDLPRCAACLYGKQHCLPTPGKQSSLIRDRQGALKQDNLLPGSHVAVDHFICSTKSRLFTSRGKTSDSQMFSGGCIARIPSDSPNREQKEEERKIQKILCAIMLTTNYSIVDDALTSLQVRI